MQRHCSLIYRVCVSSQRTLAAPALVGRCAEVGRVVVLAAERPEQRRVVLGAICHHTSYPSAKIQMCDIVCTVRESASLLTHNDQERFSRGGVGNTYSTHCIVSSTILILLLLDIGIVKMVAALESGSGTHLSSFPHTARTPQTHTLQSLVTSRPTQLYPLLRVTTSTRHFTPAPLHALPTASRGLPRSGLQDRSTSAWR